MLNCCILPRSSIKSARCPRPNYASVSKLSASISALPAPDAVYVFSLSAFLSALYAPDAAFVLQSTLGLRIKGMSLAYHNLLTILTAVCP